MNPTPETNPGTPTHGSTGSSTDSSVPVDDLAAPPPVLDLSSTDASDGVNRCPKCGSSDIQLRVSSGNLICLFCRHEWAGTRVEPEAHGAQPLRDLRGTVIATGAADITAAAGLLTLHCTGCGSDVVVNTAEATSSRCHWCRHVLSVNEQVPDGAVPDAVLPFSVTRDQAVSHIKKFAGSRQLFAHRRFVKEFTAQNVVGVYLPYLVVDSNVTGEVVGVGEIGTRSYEQGHGDDKETVHDVDVHEVRRTVDFTVDDLTLESSAERAHMDAFVNTNNVINTIQPFDTENAVRWDANYLVGFTSERRDQDVSAMMPRLETQLLSITRARVSGSLSRYDRGVRWEHEGVRVHGTRWVSMYLPVWLYSFHHEEKGRSLVHYIAVNGRTGETMGSVPVSHPRLLVAALATGTFLEGIVLAVLGAT